MITSSTSGRFCSNFFPNILNPGFPGFFLELIPLWYTFGASSTPGESPCPCSQPTISQNPLVQTDIFTSVSLSIPHKARIGLVGANGIGKTTLLRILAGLDDSSGGAVHQARNVRIGFLPQEAVLDSSLTLWEEEISVFQPLLDMQKELHTL